MIRFINDWWPLFLGVILGSFFGYYIGNMIGYYAQYI